MKPVYLSLAMLMLGVTLAAQNPGVQNRSLDEQLKDHEYVMNRRDSMIVKQTFSFKPLAMEGEWSVRRYQINDVCYYLQMAGDSYLQVLLPFPPNNTLGMDNLTQGGRYPIIATTTAGAANYEANLRKEGWTVEFDANMSNGDTYHYTLEIYTPANQATLKVDTPRYGRVTYEGQIQIN